MTARIDAGEIPDFLDRRKEPAAAHTERAHASLAPSAAHRWLACPGSLAMSQGIADKAGPYANQGTAAHELAAHCMTMGFDADRFADHVVDTTAADPPHRFLQNSDLANGDTIWPVDEEMVEGVQMYLDHVRTLVEETEGRAELDVEQRLDMTHLHPECFGTGDTTLFDTGTGVLHVVDLKYGKGVVVEVADNPQLILYGAGAARRYDNRDLTGLVLWVVQPRAPHDDGRIRKLKVHPLELMEWEDEIAAGAARVDAASADFAKGEQPVDVWRGQYLKAGEWCGFCPAFPTCPTAREKATVSALADFADGPDQTLHAPSANTLSPEELAAVLAEADYIGAWVKSVQQYAHAEATEGRVAPGYKLVPKRANRKWKDEDEAAEALVLEHGLASGDIYAQPKFKSPAQIEKLTGKKAFADIEAELVTKASSGTNLVPERDGRPAVKSSGLADFGGADA